MRNVLPRLKHSIILDGMTPADANNPSMTSLKGSPTGGAGMGMSAISLTSISLAAWSGQTFSKQPLFATMNTSALCSSTE